MTNEPFIPFALPDVTYREIEAVTAALRSGWITTGPRSKEFEAKFLEAVGAAKGAMVSSCTAALHLALEALGVGPGDEVLVPTITFASSAAVVRHLGATPVLVDVRASDHLIDVAAAESAVTERTKVIMPVHFAGATADMDEVTALARARGLRVVADSAHAFPASYRGRNVGSLADISCFSFYATKTITTGEGGAAVTENPEWAERMRVMSLHGISRDAWKRYTAQGSWYYEILAPGFKYNMTDTAAALGLVQLQRAAEMRARRVAIAARYDTAFADEPALQRLHPPSDRSHAHHLYVLKIAPGSLRIDRSAVMDELKQRGVGASVHFIPLHIHPYYSHQFGYRPESLPVAYEVYQRSFSLPFFSAMTDRQVERVIQAVCEVIDANRA